MWCRSSPAKSARRWMNGSRRGTASPRKLASGLLKKIGAGEAAGASEYVRVSDAWTVEIYPDLDGKLQPGEIEVHSELGAPQKAEYGAGSLTRRIIAPVKAEQELESDRTGCNGDSSGRVRTAGRKGQIRANKRPGPCVSPLCGPARAQQTFEVTKNQVVIGRGGRSYWVDVKLDTLPDVSREHCRIRRDARNGPLHDRRCQPVRHRRERKTGGAECFGGTAAAGDDQSGRA